MRVCVPCEVCTRVSRRDAPLCQDGSVTITHRAELGAREVGRLSHQVLGSKRVPAVRLNIIRQRMQILRVCDGRRQLILGINYEHHVS